MLESLSHEHDLLSLPMHKSAYEAACCLRSMLQGTAAMVLHLLQLLQRAQLACRACKYRECEGLAGSKATSERFGLPAGLAAWGASLHIIMQLTRMLAAEGGAYEHPSRSTNQL